MVQGLLAAGHSLADVFGLEQPGLPYRGFTVPQFFFFAERAERLKSTVLMNAISSMRAAIAGTLTKEGAKAVDRMLAEMRARTDSEGVARAEAADDGWPDVSGETDGF